MYCDRCGSPVQDQQQFCGSCGNSFAPPSQAGRAAPLAGQGRVARNLGILGILWIVYSALHLLPMGALAFLPISHAWMRPASFNWNGAPTFVTSITGPILGLGLILCVLGVIAGWGLMNRRPWARSMAIVFGCLALLNIPVGTALGIYTLWVLAPADSTSEYRQMAGAS